MDNILKTIAMGKQISLLKTTYKVKQFSSIITTEGKMLSC